jgi:hypothetical protein
LPVASVTQTMPSVPTVTETGSAIREPSHGRLSVETYSRLGAAWALTRAQHASVPQSIAVRARWMNVCPLQDSFLEGIPMKDGTGPLEHTFNREPLEEI